MSASSGASPPKEAPPMTISTAPALPPASPNPWSDPTPPPTAAEEKEKDVEKEKHRPAPLSPSLYENAVFAGPQEPARSAPPSAAEAASRAALLSEFDPLESLEEAAARDAWAAAEGHPPPPPSRTPTPEPTSPPQPPVKDLQPYLASPMSPAGPHPPTRCHRRRRRLLRSPSPPAAAASSRSRRLPRSRGALRCRLHARGRSRSMRQHRRCHRLRRCRRSPSNNNNNSSSSLARGGRTQGRRLPLRKAAAGPPRPLRAPRTAGSISRSSSTK